MKTLLISAGVALGLGALAAPASAAPFARATVIAPSATSDVGCRSVKKVTYRNGVKRVVTKQECDGYRSGYVTKKVVRPGYGYYHRPRPGITVRVN